MTRSHLKFRGLGVLASIRYVLRMAAPKPSSASKSSPRPQKTNASRRGRAFTVRMTDDQAALVSQAAEGRALDVASWIRMVAFEAAKAQLGKP